MDVVDEQQILLSLFSPIGLAQFLDEKLFDVATALCGSGPAMVFLVIEAMADGAVAMGMPRKAAIQMAAQSLSRRRPRSLTVQLCKGPDGWSSTAATIPHRSRTRSPHRQVVRSQVC